MSERSERTMGTAERTTNTAATEAFVTHRNLLFTVAYEMLGSAADAEDVLQETWLRWVERRPRHGARPARVPGADHHPPGAEPAAHARPPQGVLRRPLAARAAADRARRGRGRRARRQRLDGDADGAGDAHADRAGGVRAARGVRRSSTTRSPRPSTRPRPRSARSPTGPGRTSPRAGRAGSSPRPRPAARSRRSSGRSRPAICKACSTSSRRMSSSWATAAESYRPRCYPSLGPTRWPACCRQDRRATASCGGAGQWPPGADPPVQRRDRHVMAVRIDDGLITGLYAVRNPEKLSRIERETALRR